VNRLDRMIGAASPEDSFRVLVELQYAEYFDELTQAQDFSRIIQQGLQETKHLLVEGTQGHPGLEFLWLEFDLNNIKRALKLKYLEGASGIDSFEEKDGFSSLGNLSSESLASAVFEDRFSDNFPVAFVDVIRQTESILEANDRHFRFVEFACDQAYFLQLNTLVQRVKAPFLKNLFALKADQANLRMIARNILLFEEDFPAGMLIPFGSVVASEWHAVRDLSTFIKKFQQTADWKIGDCLSEDASPEQNVHALEKAFDQAYSQFLREAQEGEIDSISVVFNYFERRLQNARLLKFVMFSKFHGLSPDAIYKTLQQF